MTAVKEENGLRCPHCGKVATQVVDSRPTTGAIRRSRQCAGCGTRWRTVEIPYDQFKALMLHTKHWEFDTPPTKNPAGNYRSRYVIPPEKRAQVLIYRNKGLRMNEIAELLKLKEREPSYGRSHH